MHINQLNPHQSITAAAQKKHNITATSLRHFLSLLLQTGWSNGRLVSPIQFKQIMPFLGINGLMKECSVDGVTESKKCQDVLGLTLSPHSLIGNAYLTYRPAQSAFQCAVGLSHSTSTMISGQLTRKCTCLELGHNAGDSISFF